MKSSGKNSRSLRSFVGAKVLLAIALIGLALMPMTAAARKETLRLQGTVESGGAGLSGYRVSLYIAYLEQGPDWKLLGTDTSNRGGDFAITYALPRRSADEPSILFVQAERGPVLLTSAIGAGTKPPSPPSSTNARPSPWAMHSRNSSTTGR